MLAFGVISFFFLEFTQFPSLCIVDQSKELLVPKTYLWSLLDYKRVCHKMPKINNNNQSHNNSKQSSGSDKPTCTLLIILYMYTVQWIYESYDRTVAPVATLGWRSNKNTSQRKFGVRNQLLLLLHVGPAMHAAVILSNSLCCETKRLHFAGRRSTKLVQYHILVSQSVQLYVLCTAPIKEPTVILLFRL